MRQDSLLEQQRKTFNPDFHPIASVEDLVTLVKLIVGVYTVRESSSARRVTG